MTADRIATASKTKQVPPQDIPRVETLTVTSPDLIVEKAPLEKPKTGAARFVHKIGQILGHPIGTLVAIILFAIQSGWVAVSFGYGMIFDEYFHVSVSEFFTHTWSPIVQDQPKEYDKFGSLQYGSASLYHYILSKFSQILQLLTGESGLSLQLGRIVSTQVVILRLVNVGMATVGLWFFCKLFKEMGLPNYVVTLSALCYSCIPIAILVAATVSYDNFLFMLTGAFLLLAFRVWTVPRVTAYGILGLLAVGLATCLVKFTFLPVFCLVFAALAWQRRRTVLDSVRKIQISKPANRTLAMLALALILGSLFYFRYGEAVIKYKTPMPQCSQVLSHKRCVINGPYAIEQKSIATKADRKVVSFYKYAHDWPVEMMQWYDFAAAATVHDTLGSAPPNKIFRLFLFVAAYGGLFCLAIGWRSIPKRKGWGLVLSAALFNIATLFAYNVMSYYRAHAELCLQGRYLLNLIPLLAAFSIYSVTKIVTNPWLRLSILCATLAVCLTQGGGGLRYITGSDDAWIRETPAFIHDANKTLRDNLKPLTLQSKP